LVEKTTESRAGVSLRNPMELGLGGMNGRGVCLSGDETAACATQLCFIFAERAPEDRRLSCRFATGATPYSNPGD